MSKPKTNIILLNINLERIFTKHKWANMYSHEILGSCWAAFLVLGARSLAVGKILRENNDNFSFTCQLLSNVFRN